MSAPFFAPGKEMGINGVVNWLHKKRNASSRTSPRTGSRSPMAAQRNRKKFLHKVRGFCVSYQRKFSEILGDCHASVRAGSQ